MGKDTKDSIFAVILLIVGAFTLYEGSRIVALASQPPFNIKFFSVSPGMLPTILASCILLFGVMLLSRSIWGGSSWITTISQRIRETRQSSARALQDPDMHSMTICMCIMAAYTFLLLGNVSFQVGAGIFLVALMLYLRAAKLWKILVVSGVAITLITLLFVDFFGTMLP